MLSSWQTGMNRFWKWVLLLALVRLTGVEAGSADAAQPPAPARSPTATVVPGSEVKATVVLVTRIIHRAGPPLKSARIQMHAPVDLPHQDIHELEVEGHPKSATDRWGCPVLVYERAELAPGANLVGRWAAWATTRRFQWDVKAAVEGNGCGLSDAERELNLRDGRPLQLNDPVVAAAAAEAARGRSNAVEVLDGVFGLIMDRLSYDRDGKWQPAPEVLASGKGSCSEYTYCFIALSRKNGIPARYVGGIVGRAGEVFHLDRVFHRFPQACLPGHGWVDFDPTRNERANNKRLYFGQTPGPMLLLSLGDGGEGSLTGPDYLESHSWADRNARASSLRQAWWFTPPPPEVRTQVAAFRQQLDAAGSEEARAGLVNRALAIGHPFVLPWLDDLLYATGVRVEAARACLKIGGQGVLGAVVNCLGRLEDADGDRQIGRLLEEFTGEQFGSDRTRWNEWLKALTPRTPLPGDTPDRKP